MSFLVLLQLQPKLCFPFKFQTDFYEDSEVHLSRNDKFGERCLDSYPAAARPCRRVSLIFVTQLVMVSYFPPLKLLSVTMKQFFESTTRIDTEATQGGKKKKKRETFTQGKNSNVWRARWTSTGQGWTPIPRRYRGHSQVLAFRLRVHGQVDKQKTHPACPRGIETSERYENAKSVGGADIIFVV